LIAAILLATGCVSYQSAPALPSATSAEVYTVTPTEAAVIVSPVVQPTWTFTPEPSPTNTETAEATAIRTPLPYATITASPYLSAEAVEYLRAAFPLLDELFLDSYESRKLEDLTDADQIQAFVERAENRLKALQEIEPPIDMQETHQHFIRCSEIDILTWKSIQAEDYGAARKSLEETIDAFGIGVYIFVQMQWDVQDTLEASGQSP